MTASDGTAVVEPPPLDQVPSGRWFLASHSSALSTAASTCGGTGSSWGTCEAGCARAGSARDATVMTTRIALLPVIATLRASAATVALQAGDADVIVLDHLAVRRRAALLG